MASTTSDGSASAARWRAAQLGLARLLLRDLRGIRRLVDPSRLQASMPAWIEAVTAIVARYSEVSATLAADVYDGERVAAGVPGAFTVPLADPPPGEQVDASMRWATKDLWPRGEAVATVAQQEPLDVRMEAAMTKADGATQKLVADRGRATLRQAVKADPQAVAYARAAALGACSFCKLMASRGAVYATADSAGRDANELFSGDASVVKFHDNCVPAGTLVDGPTAEVGYRRWYEGEMLVIGTAAGRQLSITPNHPVLTDRGWVPAGLLSPGEYVLGSFNAQGSLLQVPDEEHMPSRIEEVWRALSVLGLVSVPVAAEDFHGDGADGEVDVVRADGLLWRHFKGVTGEVLAENPFARARVGKGAFAHSGSCEELLGWNTATSRRIMGRFSQETAFLGRHLGEPVVLGGAAVTHVHSGFREHAADDIAIDLEALGEGEFALAAAVSDGNLFHGEIGAPAPRRDSALLKFTRERRRRHAAEIRNFGECLAAGVQADCSVELTERNPVGPRRFDPPGLYSSVDGGGAYARLGRDLGERLAGRVERDCVVEIRRTEFAGHVYNLQTEQGWYRADGVIVSNCHCAIIPVFRGQRFELSPHAQEWDRLYREYAQGHPGDQLRLFRRAIAEHG